MRGLALMVIALAAACDAAAGVDALPSCWTLECPGDPGASTCGRCNAWPNDVECPPGFVCNCVLECVRGPRTPDGGIPSFCFDAGPPDIDAAVHDWSVCDIGDPQSADLP